MDRGGRPDRLASPCADLPGRPLGHQRQVGRHVRSINEVARELRCDWHTTNEIVVYELRAHDDPDLALDWVTQRGNDPKDKGSGIEAHLARTNPAPLGAPDCAPGATPMCPTDYEAL
jgi:hypothetical protein